MKWFDRLGAPKRLLDEPERLAEHDDPRAARIRELSRQQQAG